MIDHLKPILGSALLIAAVSGSAIANEADEKYRGNVMKGVGSHASALGQIAKQEVPHFTHMQGHADALMALSNQVLDAFRSESISDKSRAKPEIWSDWAGFESKANDFRTAATAVADAARSGHAGEVGGTLKALFDSCKGCHEDYRKPKKE